MIVKDGRWHRTKHKYTVKIATCLNCGQMCSNENEKFCSPKCRKAYRKGQHIFNKFKKEKLRG